MELGVFEQATLYNNHKNHIVRDFLIYKFDLTVFISPITLKVEGLDLRQCFNHRTQ